MRFFTESKLSARKGLTPEGYLVCYDVPIGRVGEQLYGAEELPDVTPDARGEIRISRPAEEVFAEESMRSYEGKPVVIEHPDVPVTPENWRELAMGHAQNVRRQGDLLLADLMITDTRAAKLITSGQMREISCGYDAEYEETGPGAGVQRQITGNHIALVERGRCGPRCAIQDHKRGGSMAGKKKSLKDRLRAVFTRTLDEALEEVAELEGGGTPGKIEIEVKGLEDTKSCDGDPPPTKDEPETEVREGAIEKMIADLGKRFDVVEKRLTALEASDKKVHSEMGDGEEISVDEALEGGDSDPAAKTGDEDDPKKAETTDRARRAIWRDALHRASILAPGLRVPTYDSARTGQRFADAVCGMKRRALDAAYATADGQRVLEPWLGGATSIRTLDCLTVDAAFSAASDALARANNRSLSFGDAAPAPSRGGMTPEQMNLRAASFWDARKGGK